MMLSGASRGIGHATVQRFSAAGWRVVTCSREAVPDECKADPNWTHDITAEQRMGSPADAAETVFWLCSPEAGYVTGTEVFVTGGQHLL